MRKDIFMNISNPGKRLFAFILDMLISFLISIAVLFIISAPLKFFPLSTFINDKISVLAIISYVISAILFFNSAFIIQMFFWSKGSSIGKHLLKMKVVDKNSKLPIGFWKMAFRETILKYVSSLYFGLGFLWIIIDSQSHQAWHDKILETVVVDLDIQ